MSNASDTANVDQGTDISDSFSALFFGSIISFVRYGCTNLDISKQISGLDPDPVFLCASYFPRPEDLDSVSAQHVVYRLLNVACTCLVTVHLNNHLILHFGSDLSLLLQNSVPFQINTLLTTFIITAVDLFLAKQVHDLGQLHWSVGLTIAVTAVVAFCMSVVTTTITLVSESTAEQFLASRAGIAITATDNALFTLSELLASGGLAWSLHRSKTGIKRTDGILAKLFTWMVTRGALLSVIQLLQTILFFAQPFTLNWIPFHLFQSKLYVITTLSLLNSRKALRRRVNLFTSSYTESTGDHAISPHYSGGDRQRRGTIDIAYRLGPNGTDIPDGESALGVRSSQKDQEPSLNEQPETAFQMQKMPAGD
ncbi:hypothetical protein K435DRAFT_864378 [Dendrothele bispora CBS 962.96]|uniref:DUF6534 domain-containing protein n=1 Tax=Dendrothele bispora (strain CBS 962.96) TaxID=1314807 RepID=A0A4V4HEA4_DENBC|nr:hypothetical protein K435DRAFT_864378 [Dendrothele bispora CBS 962.96]